ncbi:MULTISPECIES: TetR/AcrR family transcriptional regulator [unclassified Actinobaculum]|uniref:TetR/AcrR family transcriptional regulator n=1 Tax=unclassified Actinobaculum TaxID=2609299 RepID=UPI001F0C3FF2|nr:MULTISPECIES: TetR/AcrR family transcriptional regulator [unclassified Actinobaculum]
MSDSLPAPHLPTPKRVRMTRAERREQLIRVARELFGARGYDAVSIEEIASAAEVSKPVIYEHFGGKEGLYQVIVDRELTTLTDMLAAQMRPELPPRAMLEGIVLSLLDYIEDSADGFRLLSHQSPSAVTSGTFSTVIADVAEQVADLLAPLLERQGLDPKTAPIYGQLLAGAIGRIGQWWADDRLLSKEETAAHVTNLVWFGLRAMERNPHLVTLGRDGGAPASEG